MYLSDQARSKVVIVEKVKFKRLHVTTDKGLTNLMRGTNHAQYDEPVSNVESAAS